MDFEPKTQIWFCHTGIDDFNKIPCNTEDELFATITKEGNVYGRMTETSFQRADGYFIIRVDSSAVNYYSLLESDTIIYRNDETSGAFWIVGNIVSVEWKNPDCSFVKFKIDAFMTYQVMINWGSTYALVEREHVKEDWSADGGNPLFSNMGPAEDFGVSADTPFYSWTKNFNPEMVLVLSPYNSSGEAVFEGTVKGNLYTSVQSDILTPEEANAKFKAIAEKKTASINNIVGVYGIPQDWVRVISSGGLSWSGDKEENVPSVNIAASQLPTMPTYNNAKCWSAPFVNIRLMSSEGQTIDFTPQWFGNDQNEYTIRYRAAGCGGMFGGAQCTFQNKNGAFNWDVWNDFIVELSQLPNCPWTSDGYTDWAANNLLPTVYNTTKGVAMNTLGTIGGAVSTVTNRRRDPVGGAVNTGIGLVGNLADSIGAGIDLASTINQHKASGATLNAGGNFSSLFDIGAGKWGFKLVYYTVQQYIMNSVDGYFDRFGYRVNRLKKLELTNRPIWTFIKTAECHVNASLGIPVSYQNVINEMFNHGVTFWNRDKYMSGRRIGDFSGASDNKGIKGAV